MLQVTFSYVIEELGYRLPHLTKERIVSGSYKYEGNSMEETKGKCVKRVLNFLTCLFCSVWFQYFLTHPIKWIEWVKKAENSAWNKYELSVLIHFIKRHFVGWSSYWCMLHGRNGWNGSYFLGRPCIAIYLAHDNCKNCSGVQLL